MTFGVVPTGFARKSLLDIIAELQQAMIDHFGPDVIQTEASPFGQLNGMHSDIAAEAWETAEDTYQSFDVDQATAGRLDTVAKLRRLTRNSGESDGAFRLRITNEGQANIKLTENVNRLRAIEGVTFAAARENYNPVPDALDLPPHSIAYCVVGGDDYEVGELIYQMSVPGIGLYGNTDVEIVADGYCQHARFIRPSIVPIRVEIDVRHVPDPCDCVPPSIGTIQKFVIDAFAGTCAYVNGDTVLADRVMVETAQIGGLKIMEIRMARADNLILLDAIPTTIFELPVIISPYVKVRFV